jgi:hypothetical protein
MRFAKIATLGFVASIALACGGISIPSIPSFAPFPSNALPSGPTLPPGVLPSDSGTCAFMTSAELGAIMGGAATLTDTSNGDCTFTMSNFSSVSISVESDTDLQGAHILFGTTAQDITVGGLPAVSGVFIGQPAIYVQKGGSQLQVMGILTGSDEATMGKLVQVATLALSRWPG